MPVPSSTGTKRGTSASARTGRRATSARFPVLRSRSGGRLAVDARCVRELEAAGRPGPVDLDRVAHGVGADRVAGAEENEIRCGDELAVQGRQDVQRMRAARAEAAAERPGRVEVVAAVRMD